MYVNPQDIEALYTSIHRLAQQHVPGCTIEQVRKSANRFYGGGMTRVQSAFFIYWELAESRLEDSYASRFLVLVREKVEEVAAREQQRKEEATAIRDYWKQGES
jgi:hypothetical protein